MNEIILSNPDSYLSINEVLKICVYEQILMYEGIEHICQEIDSTFKPSETIDEFQHHDTSPTDYSLGSIQERFSEKSLVLNIDQYDDNHTDINKSNLVNSKIYDYNRSFFDHLILTTICLGIRFILERKSNLQETSITVQSIFDCYTRCMSMYNHDSILQHQIEQRFLLIIFDYILHFNHRTIINAQLQQLLGRFKPVAFYKAQLLMEKEMKIIKLLLKIRQKRAILKIDDLNRYLQSYPIPCRL